ERDAVLFAEIEPVLGEPHHIPTVCELHRILFGASYVDPRAIVGAFHLDVTFDRVSLTRVDVEAHHVATLLDRVTERHGDRLTIRPPHTSRFHVHIPERFEVAGVGRWACRRHEGE